MQIERTKNEIIIKIAPETNLVGLQRIADYVEFREIASKSKATQEQIDALAYYSKSSWWEENQNQFIK